MTIPHHVLATAAFRRWCWLKSNAVYSGDGKLGPLRRILADLPLYFV